jgi:SSS family transporter
VSLHLWIFGLYFLVVFGIGWYSLRHTRDETDYWIAGGKLGWAVGGATLAATHTSAGTFIGTIGVMYTVGWSFGWLVLSIPLAYWFTAAVLAPRFTRVKELTLPAFLEARYQSKGVRALAAVVILVATVVYIQAQIVAGGLIANIVFGIPTRWGMVGFTVILLAYTVIGGMKAVVYTDFVQLVIMILGVVLAVPLAVRQVDGWDHLFTYVEAVNPLTFTWHGLPGTLLFTMGLAFMLGSVATPEKLIRLYAMKDMPTIRRGVLFAIVVITSVNLLVFILSLAAVVLFPVLPTGDLAMPMIARAVLPPTLGALMLAAITSAMMSTVDSLLIVAGSALSYDIFHNLVSPRASEAQRVGVDRLGILVVGTIPVLLLLFGVGEGELVQFIVLLFTALMASAFFMPVVLGVYWARATKEGAAAAMIGGVAATFLWKVLGPETIDPVLPGFIVSTLLMVGVSLATPPPAEEALAPYFPGRAKGGEGRVGFSS